MKSSALFQKCTTGLLLPLWLSGMICVPAGYAQTAPPAPTTPIQHVVVIFQENVSFDHYFATYPSAANTTSGEPSFNAAANTPAVNGLTAAGLLTANPNSMQPVRLSRSQAVTCDQDHSYDDEQKAVNGGLMNKFVESTASFSASCDVGGLGKRIVMGYYDGNTVTAMWNYAQNYAMSDNFFGSMFGPSTPGVLSLIAGSTANPTLKAGSATGYIAGNALINDARPFGDDCTPSTTTQVTMGGKNIGDLLNGANLTWGWFQGGFKPTATTNGVAACGATHNNVSGASAGADYIPHHAGFQYYPSTANPHHLPPTSVAAIGKTDQANHNYDISDFNAALAAGNLPAVSYLKAGAYQDGHAGYSDPLDEQTFVVNEVNAIMASPFWSSTAIIITYDDSDGFYDHVMAPIINQSATADDNLVAPGSCGAGGTAASQGRCGYGPRLPLLVISPFAKVNYVDHNTTDQSSVLRFIEDNWSLGRLGNGSTDAIAGSMNTMFNFKGFAPAVQLNPATGSINVAASNGSTTQAVANPRSAQVTSAATSLDGSGSTSFDGKPLSYQWTVSPGYPAAMIAGPNTEAPTVTFSSGPGQYSFTLTVTDSAGNKSTAIAMITVTL